MSKIPDTGRFDQSPDETGGAAKNDSVLSDDMRLIFTAAVQLRIASIREGSPVISSEECVRQAGRMFQESILTTLKIIKQ